MKTKRFISLALALIMVLGSFGLVSANTAVTTAADPYARIVESGIFKGDNGDLMLDKTFNRAEFAAVALRLKGEGFTDAETEALKIASSFTDVDAKEWYAPYVGRAQKEGLVEGDNNKYLPKDDVSYVEALTIVMRALGYVDGVDLVNYPSGYYAKAAQIGLADATIDANAKIVRKVIADTLETALDLELKDSDITLAQELGIEDVVVTPETLEVAEVVAKSASSFLVKFNKAVEDTGAIKFSVKRASTAINVTTTWNADKTEATLAGTSNFAEGAYAVTVNDGETELASETLNMTQQKVAKIEITSDKLAVVSNNNQNIGYATYKVFDQYGTDITNSHYANNLRFQAGVGGVGNKNGILTVTPNGGVNLMQFAQVAITGYDGNTGVSVTKTLQTSITMGTLSDIELLEITNVDGSQITDGDHTSTFYISYIARDMSGNATKSYELVSNGLLLNNGELNVSHPNVKVTVEEDPTDSTKAVLQLKVVAGDPVLMDMPLTITAMTFTGKTSTINTTIKKAAQVATFNLMAPAEVIASGDTGKAIPFEAYDQHGAKITKIEDLDGPVTLNGGIRFVRNVDGTAKVEITPTNVPAGAGSIQQFVSAVVGQTGYMSTLTLSVQEAAVADKLEVDYSKFITAMQTNAEQEVKFDSGIKVKDQYGRYINMVDTTRPYVVKATATGAISQDNTNLVANFDRKIKVTANSVGSGTVRFELYANQNDANNNANPLDTKSVTLSVVKDEDIKGYMIDEVAKDIYANPRVVASLTDRDKDYTANPKVYGKTASGAKVLLAGKPVVGAYVSNTKDFNTESVTGFVYGEGKYDVVKVVAGQLDANRTSASTTLTVTLLGADGRLHSVTTPVNSSTAAPVASTVGVDVKKFKGVRQSGDRLTITSATLADNFADGLYLSKFKADGSKPAPQSNITFFAQDQYGKKAMQLAEIRVVNATVAAGVTVSVNSDGQLSIKDANGNSVNLVTGNSVTISAVSTNGMVKTVEIVVGQ